MRVRDPSSGAAGSPRAGDNIPSPGTPFPVGLRPSVTVVLGVTVMMDTMGQSPSNNLRLGERSKDRYARTGTRLDEADVAQCQRPGGIPSIDSWTYTDGSMITELCTSRAREVTAIKKIQKKWDFPRVISEFDWGSGGAPPTHLILLRTGFPIQDGHHQRGVGDILTDVRSDTSSGQPTNRSRSHRHRVASHQLSTMWQSAGAAISTGPGRPLTDGLYHPGRDGQSWVVFEPEK